MGPEGIGAAYELLSPGGPHQSICDGNTECVVDPIKRSSATLGLLHEKLEVEEPHPRSNGATEFMNEELPDGKGALVKLLKDLGTENRYGLIHGHKRRKN